MITRTFAPSLGLVVITVLNTGCPEPRYGAPYYVDYEDYDDATPACQNLAAQAEELRSLSFEGSLDKWRADGEPEERYHVSFVLDPASIATLRCVDGNLAFSGKLSAERWRISGEGEGELIEVLLDEVPVEDVPYTFEDREPNVAYGGFLWMESPEEAYPPQAEVSPHSTTFRINWALHRDEVILGNMHIARYGEFVDDPDERFNAAHSHHSLP